jgi:hypothetical protein
MGVAGLHRALAKKAPLVDVVVQFRDGLDYPRVTEEVNALRDDFDLHTGDWYGIPGRRLGTATAEALERLLGWRHVRVPLARYDEATDSWGTWPDYFRWQELNEPQLDRFPLAGVIESIGITQPAADDDCQWYEPVAEPGVAADAGPE